MIPTVCRPISTLSADDLAVAGGKGANLGELVRAGFDVPDGFVVTTDAYREAMADRSTPTAQDVRQVAIPAGVRAEVLSAYGRLGGGSVAVRSSATAEDLPGAAFAGQQDTFLGILGEDDLLEAIRCCWASLWTERAISYRDRLGLDSAEVTIAVVVQRMVPADRAGVMFTADPVTGARDRVVIDSNPGLGEAVVAGLVTPDHAVVDAAGHVVERRNGQREAIIRAVASGGTETVVGAEAAAHDSPFGVGDLAALARVGRAIATHFGRPQDIEWAVSGGDIAILQARPMTALPPAPIPLSRVQRFVGPVILELLPRRPYPMELGAWMVPTIGVLVERMLDEIAGARVSLVDIVPAQDDVVQAFVPPHPRPTAHTLARLLRSLSRTRRNVDDWRHDPLQQRYLTEATALAATDVAKAKWAVLVKIPTQASHLVDLVTEVRIGYLPAAAGGLIRLRLLLRVLGVDGVFQDLAAHAPTLTREANDALANLARVVREDDQLARAFTDLDGDELLGYVETDPAATDFAQGLSTFLNHYGHRETASILLLREPTWVDDPKTVLTLVAVLAANRTDASPQGTDRRSLDTLLQHPLIRRTHTQERVRRLVATAAAGVALREDTHFEATRLMPVTRRAVVEAGRRLAGAGVIDHPDDIWYLSWPDVATLADPAEIAPAARKQISETVQRRRAAYAELAGSPLIATSTLYPDAGVEADVLVSGAAGAGGRAAGPVRVVHGPEQFGLLRSGEVLVCPTTNPSWTPLFTRAAAVVVDHGGVASHAAIVAREYGIPAVMGCGRGTTVLSDGQQIIVDGDRGVVLLADPPNALRG